MNHKILIALGIVVFALVSSCTKNVKKEQINAIAAQEKSLFEAQEIDRLKGLQLIDTYVNFSKQYPDDSLSANYLYKAGEIAMNLKLGTQSIFYFDKIITNFPTFSKVPECVFLKAFVFENQLNDLEKASRYYNEFIIQFPNHLLVKDAKASLEYLGKSPEELVRIFQEKNKEK
jgi:outer membrane protein assembly factor BamD (BamD/ComL family)